MPHALQPITLDHIDADAAKVVKRLTRHGHEAYLVGGCVRDLLLGKTPKDFDVATDATPDEIRALFRNCRIIGRRFRLAHIFFGSKIIETATFRSNPRDENEASGGDPLIRRDNVFGTAEEDALRRDFTINGLFYDVNTGKVLDAVGGLADLRARIVRTIGAPDDRMPEDPVRILRAVKFATRLELGIAPQTRAAMVHHRGLIPLCPTARVLEEIYKLLRGGAATRAMRAMHELGVLDVLFPELAGLLPPPSEPEARTDVPALQSTQAPPPPFELPEHADPATAPARLLADGLLHAVGLEDSMKRRQAGAQLWAHLEALDRLVARSEAPPEPPVLLGTLLSPLASDAWSSGKRARERAEQIDALVRGVAARIQVSRRHRERLKQIMIAQHRFTAARARASLAQRDYFPEALQLLELRHDAIGGLSSPIERWRALRTRGPKKRTRRRRRGRQG